MTGDRDGAVVLVTARSFSAGRLDLEAELTERGCRVVRGPADHDLEQLRPTLAAATAWIAGVGPITPEHLDAAPGLKIIARYGVGVDAVDRPAAAARGIMITNTPGANTVAVAEHALALLLALLRNVVRDDRLIRTGDHRLTRARELGALTVGVIGLGRIGRELTARLTALGVGVLAYDPMLSDADIRAAGAEPAALAELPSVCDAISLHAPGDQRVIDSDWLINARPDLLVINTARSALVDEAMIAEALRSERLGGYATDDLGPAPDSATHPLLADEVSDRVIVTPHSAAQTVQAVDRMGRGAVDAVLAALAGEAPEHQVRAPSGATVEEKHEDQEPTR